MPSKALCMTRLTSRAPLVTGVSTGCATHLASTRSRGPIYRASHSLFAQGKGTLYTLETTEAEQIVDLMTFYGLRKWGFIVYRCTYEDDAARARFMKHLDQLHDHVLRNTYDNSDLIERLDWSVQEAASLAGATKDEVRRRFKQWVATDAHAKMPTTYPGYVDQADLLRENPRYKYCVHVDEDALQSVLQRNTEPPTDPTTRKASYVNLIRADSSWDGPDFNRLDWSDYEPPDPEEDEDMYDEREREIEGSRLRDVGCMRVKFDSLVPAMYATLTPNHMWDHMYHRPPEIAER